MCVPVGSASVKLTMTKKTAPVILLLMAVFFPSAYLSEVCATSGDCLDDEGRSLCFGGRCRKDVPCTKDNDCFFYGASDIVTGRYRPLCFQNVHVPSHPRYGICMIENCIIKHIVYQDGITRFPGSDASNALQSTTVRCKNY